jgi:hypothetical protein
VRNQKHGPRPEQVFNGKSKSSRLPHAAALSTLLEGFGCMIRFYYCSAKLKADSLMLAQELLGAHLLAPLEILSFVTFQESGHCFFLTRSDV